MHPPQRQTGPLALAGPSERILKTTNASLVQCRCTLTNKHKTIVHSAFFEHPSAQSKPKTRPPTTVAASEGISHNSRQRTLTPIAGTSRLRKRDRMPIDGPTTGSPLQPRCHQLNGNHNCNPGIQIQLCTTPKVLQSVTIHISVSEPLEYVRVSIRVGVKGRSGSGSGLGV